MLKKAIFGLVIILVLIGVGAWYYFSRVHYSKIESILSNPGSYEGKVVTIQGDVTDRTSFFVDIKFYKVKDDTGEITVVTKKNLPGEKTKVRVKGKVDKAFPVGDLKLIVFREESLEENTGNK